MNRKRNAVSQVNEDDEKEENAVVRILQSRTCRRLFSWGLSDETFPAEITAEAREEQKLRWNFDFQTETPLPGRYQWVRSSEANGHKKNGSDEPERKRPCGGESSSQKRQTSQSQYRRAEKRRAQPESSRASTASESAVSCDKALKEAEDSGRPLDLKDAYGIDCT